MWRKRENEVSVYFRVGGMGWDARLFIYCYFFLAAEAVMEDGGMEE